MCYTPKLNGQLRLKYRGVQIEGPVWPWSIESVRSQHLHPLGLQWCHQNSESRLSSKTFLHWVKNIIFVSPGNFTLIQLKMLKLCPWNFNFYRFIMWLPFWRATASPPAYFPYNKVENVQTSFAKNSSPIDPNTFEFIGKRKMTHFGSHPNFGSIYS